MNIKIFGTLYALLEMQVLLDEVKVIVEENYERLMLEGTRRKKCKHLFDGSRIPCERTAHFLNI